MNPALLRVCCRPAIVEIHENQLLCLNPQRVEHSSGGDGYYNKYNTVFTLVIDSIVYCTTLFMMRK
jgi:hypothetical protein